MSFSLRRRLASLLPRFTQRSMRAEVNGTVLHMVGGASFGDHDTAWLNALLQGTARFLDVGAHVGSASLLGATQRCKHIVAVDATAESLALAARNMLMNAPETTYTTVWAAVTDRTGDVLTFLTAGTGAANSLYADHALTAADVGERVRVPTMSIDDICARNRFEPDVIKVDIEGAEALAFQGARKTIAACQPRFFVEMHSRESLSMAANAESVLETCREVGYDAWYLKSHSKLETAATIAHRGRCHLLLQARGAAYPEALEGIRQAQGLDAVA